ncbi:MAG TPA: LapA family protein [Aestuariivirga sp.]|nr:LapA family protein [Aestuariivirga sp.]
MTLKRIFNWIIGLPIAIAAAVFAVANRQWIVVSFDPFSRDQPFASINMPLWVLFFCGIFAGLIAGWIAAWFAHGKWRRAARQARLELMRAQHEHEMLKRENRSQALVPTGDPLS